MVTVPFTAPAGGDTAVMMGLSAINITLALLVIEFTVTVSGPEPVATVLGTRATICVSLQLVIEVAATPLNFTVLLPGEAPKFDPEMVTGSPAPAVDGEIPATYGVVPPVKDTLSKVAVTFTAIPM